MNGSSDSISSEQNYTHSLPKSSKIRTWVTDTKAKHGRFTIAQQQEDAHGSKSKASKQGKTASDTPVEAKKQAGSGDDFFFLQENNVEANGRLLICGVADGVGGWSESGVDPSAFSQALMFYADKAAQSALVSEKPSDASDASEWTDGDETYPHNILQKAFDDVQKDSEIEAGESLFE